MKVLLATVLLVLLLSGCASQFDHKANWKLVHETDEFDSWTCYIDQNKPVALRHQGPFDTSNMFDAQCFRYLKGQQ